MKNLNISRIGALLKYDWMLNKKSAYLYAVILTAVYICFALLYFDGRFTLGLTGDITALPTLMGMFVSSFFSYAQIGMLFVVTAVLHHKFTDAHKATTYLTLPSTNLEKWAVMLLDYIIAAAAIYVMYIVYYYLSMVACWMASPELDWFRNPFTFGHTPTSLDEILVSFDGFSLKEALEKISADTSNPLAQALSTYINASIYMSIFVVASEALVYICVNMCFKTNGQLKTIACYLAFSAVMIMALVIVSFSFAAYCTENPDAITDESIIGIICGVMNFLSCVIYMSPLFVVGLSYLFYRQICKKQDK